MRILILGAGAIGSLIGHRLLSAGYSITLIGRAEVVRAIRERGLRLDEPPGGPPRSGSPLPRSPAERGRLRTDGFSRSSSLHSDGSSRSSPPRSDGFSRFPPEIVHPGAFETIAKIPPSERQWDLAVLTVKVYDTSEAVQALASGLSQRPPLLILQNGVGGEELARQAWGGGDILSGAITLPVSVLAPAHVRLEMTRGGMGLAPTQPGQPVDPWAACFVAAGFRVATHADYRAMRWSKLLLNIQANAIPAILDMPPGAVFADPILFSLERAAFQEALAVMRAQHLRPVGFPSYPVPLLAWAWQNLPNLLLRPVLRRLVAGGRGDKPPSLQIGLATGQQRSEVLYLNGAVVAAAQRLGLRAPVNGVIVDTLMGIAKGEIPWDDFRHQPQKLVAAVRAEKGQ